MKCEDGKECFAFVDKWRGVLDYHFVLENICRKRGDFMKRKFFTGVVFVWFIFSMAAGMLQSQDAQAAKVGKYKLSDTSTNGKYDVTGDGVPDKVEIKKLNKSGDSDYYGFKIIINGKTALKNDKCWYYYNGLDVVFMQTIGHGYFFISTGYDNGDGIRIIYEYVGGRLKKRMDLSNVAKKLSYDHHYVDVSTVKARSIRLKLSGQTAILGSTKLTFELKVGKKGKLSLGKKAVGVTYMMWADNDKYFHQKYLTAAQKIQVYKSETGTKKAFCIKKGTKLKITRASMKGKKSRYYCITKSGKKGWINSKDYLFKNMAYAG